MIFDLHYAGLQHAWTLPFFLGLLGLRLYLCIQRLRTIQKLSKKNMHSSFSKKYELIKCGIFSMMILGSYGMLLRPQWNKIDTVIPQEGRDVLFLLDISRSMKATDIAPNRLEVAKLKIRQLLRLLSCERVGLILFSGSAFVQCPLTKDFASLELFVNHVDTETISSGTTAIDKALQLGIDVFSHMQNRKHKTMLLITDGEDFSTQFEHIIQKSIEQNIRICTLGIGTEEGAPIPIFNQYGKTIGVEKNATGEIILSKLNRSLLETVSQKLQGCYVHSSPDTTDITTIKKFFDSIEKETIDNESLVQWDDHYHRIAQILFPLALIEWFL